ncbi:MAG: GMC oxidoreductase [Cyanobacteria bacterium J06639_18]
MSKKYYGRRRFLQTSALFSASLAVSVAFPHHTKANEEVVEAIVIGSGFGGSVAALRLGQAGVSTLVLERGRRWKIKPDGTTFATFDKPDGRASWLSPTTILEQPVDIYTGVMEVLNEDGITVWSGAGVGGGSLVYNTIIYQPREDLFYKVFPKKLINYEELAQKYYPRVRSILQASPIPDDILATPYYEKVRLLIEHANRAGFPNYLLDLATDWNTVRQEISGAKMPSNITGNIWWGVNSGAKNSLDQNYLRQAEQTGYVEILPLHVVTEIYQVAKNRYKVICNEINESGEVFQQKVFTCRYLFLAAGSMGTSKLLVKAKAKGTLPKLSKFVGRSWGANGDIIATRSNLGNVRNNGGPSGAVIEMLDDTKYPHSVMNLDAGYNNVEGVQQLLAVGIEPPSGRFIYNRSTDSVKLRWNPNSRNRAFLSAVGSTIETLDSRNTDVIEPTSEYSASITAHPLGGAAMGKVCDGYGRVYNYPGLYVVDGALIPAGSTASTNPSFTIAAIAERCLEKIVTRDIEQRYLNSEY